MSWVISGKTDPDFAAYIAAVEQADGQTLEVATRQAIYNFIIGCKSDGIWNAIKASCILAGARTLTGALVPLVGTAPTNNNFVSGDYNRKTGLVGNGSTKYLDSSYSTFGLDSVHLSISISAGTGLGAYMGVLHASNNCAVQLSRHPQTDNRASILRTANISANVFAGASGATLGFVGGSKTQAGLHSHRSGATTISRSETTLSEPSASNIYVFNRNSGGPSFYAPSGHRFAFYSIGESLNLALLDTRVTDLINAFAAAIP
jgi:hypothetical protein